MSASIHYRPTAKSDPYIKGIFAPSSFIESITRAFGAFPCELDESHIPTLRGMAAMCQRTRINAQDLEVGDPFSEIISKIEAHGSIELYAKY